MELIAELLRQNRHEITVLSQGAVVEHQAKYYPGLCEPQPFERQTPIFYASALPVAHVNGGWSALQTLRLFRQHHRLSPFDVAIVYNLQFPQALCAAYALRRLEIPVILEYEDDALVDVKGTQQTGWNEGLYQRLARKILTSVSGSICVSPHLATQVPADKPRMLLRGVVSPEIPVASQDTAAPRKNWVVFSGTHFRTKGLEPLLAAWELVKAPDWELHIAGHGEKTVMLEEMARGNKSIVFHGLLNRQENAQLLRTAKIGMNPHDLSAVPGNVFAFKIVEYLAAGNHVITTPMGPLEQEFERGITYIPDNSAQTIAAALQRVIDERHYERIAMVAAHEAYGPAAVAGKLDTLLRQVSQPPTDAFSPLPATAGR